MNIDKKSTYLCSTHPVEGGAVAIIGRCGAIAAALLLTGGCAWVSPNVESQWVSLVKPAAVAGCTQIGETTSKTLTKVVVVGRSTQKQQNELITLAKNQAAVMTGDTIVAKGDMNEGEQTFKVYNCQ